MAKKLAKRTGIKLAMKIKPRSIKNSLNIRGSSLYHPPIPVNMTVVIDTREQLPYMFSGCRIINKKLDAGDYSIYGWEDKISVERKSAIDFYNCLINRKDGSRNRDRFERELERLKNYEFKALVIEESEQDILCPEIFNSGISKNSIYGSIVSFEIKYGINVYYGNRKWCENKILNWFICWTGIYGDGINIGMEI